MRRADAVTAVVDVLPSLPSGYVWAVVFGRVGACCTACGERLDAVGRPAGYITKWTEAHTAIRHATVTS